MHQPGFIVVETNYRLYAYTGETDRGPLGEQMRSGSGEGKEARGDAVYVYIYWWFTELSDISPHV